ncbi:hypothetical protein IP90_03233 [Luteimonas cucumeris]|uniref:Uncharacterized protein n=1 Tax=Luteimonas cucumeris TaxID=985012 RepID=A0A562KUN6_9GAMM|nr:hypothetical protein [Luteimonas cucumeris]TWH99054.1 hypothetical protein IP90_03233 [Luteimonas cucumeris]
MNGTEGYAVFFFPQALEALGEAIKPYLMQADKAEPWVLCHQIDTAGALLEMTLQGHNAEGAPVEIELMVPNSMVRMIVSARSDEVFGFSPHRFTKVAPAASAIPAAPATEAAGKPKA